VLAVDIDAGWHIYAMNLPGRDGLLATRVRLENDRFPAVDGWRESPPKLALDQALDQVIKVHSRRAEFRQVRSVPKDLPPGNYSIGGSVIYRACDDKICSLPSSLPFEARVTVAGNG